MALASQLMMIQQGGGGGGVAGLQDAVDAMTLQAAFGLRVPAHGGGGGGGIPTVVGGGPVGGGLVSLDGGIVNHHGHLNSGSFGTGLYNGQQAFGGSFLHY
jgi:hypothetical protein